jgi:hypothetical protein
MYDISSDAKVTKLAVFFCGGEDLERLSRAEHCAVAVEAVLDGVNGAVREMVKGVFLAENIEGYELAIVSVEAVAQVSFEALDFICRGLGADCDLCGSYWDGAAWIGC